ncbi:MAG: hypothetical protein Q8R83_04540 [Legionellaceae bacterium]|nr:hypothetical protein [Legionellaceae bacterium]
MRNRSESELDRILNDALNESFLPTATAIATAVPQSVAISAEEYSCEVESSIDMLRRTYRQILEVFDSPLLPLNDGTSLQTFLNVKKMAEIVTLFNDDAKDFIEHFNGQNMDEIYEIINYMTYLQTRLQETHTIFIEQIRRLDMEAQQSSERLAELRDPFNHSFESSQQPQISTLLPRIILFQSGDTEFDRRHQHQRNIPIIAVSSGDQTFDEENQDSLEAVAFINR